MEGVHGNIPIIVTGLYIIFVISLGKGYINRKHGMSYLKIFNLLLSGLGVILIWRSIMGLIDLYLYPWDRETSCWIGLCMGFALTGIFVFDFSFH